MLRKRFSRLWIVLPGFVVLSLIVSSSLPALERPNVRDRVQDAREDLGEPVQDRLDSGNDLLEDFGDHFDFEGLTGEQLGTLRELLAAGLRERAEEFLLRLRGSRVTGVSSVSSVEEAVTVTSPVSSGNRVSAAVMRQVVLPAARSRAEEQQAARERESGTPRMIMGVVRYEKVGFDEGEDGSIPGATLGLAWDMDRFSTGILVPFDYLDFDSFSGHRLGAVLFGRFNHPFSEVATLGATLHGCWLYTNIRGQDDGTNVFGIGPSATLSFDWDTVTAGFAAGYQYSRYDIESANDFQHLVKVGGNLGFRAGSSGVITIYGIWNRDLSDYLENSDFNSFFDAGIEVSWNLTDTFTLEGGYKKVLGIDEYDSDTGYLGGRLLI